MYCLQQPHYGRIFGLVSAEPLQGTNIINIAVVEEFTMPGTLHSDLPLPILKRVPNSAQLVLIKVSHWCDNTCSVQV